MLHVNILIGNDFLSYTFGFNMHFHTNSSISKNERCFSISLYHESRVYIGVDSPSFKSAKKNVESV